MENEDFGREFDVICDALDRSEFISDFLKNIDENAQKEVAIRMERKAD